MVMTGITHTTTGADSLGSVTSLPPGVTAAWAGNTITISGTPTATGTYDYHISLMGGCGAYHAHGRIIVNWNTNTVAAASSTETLCINTALTDITHALSLIHISEPTRPY